ncbi:MAG: hypothetical protein KAR40_17405 [Candidatus Sabulitectum sp.]|nr:hypothetical protein [Candidatus Sabulitectum sp.]
MRIARRAGRMWQVFLERVLLKKWPPDLSDGLLTALDGALAKYKHLC